MKPDLSRPGHRGAELALASIALVWGVTFVLVKNALDDASTLLFLGLRFGLAAVALAGLYGWRRRGRFSGHGWAGGVLTGTFLFAGYLLQTVGLRFTTPAKSGFLTGLYIVLVPLLAALVYRRIPRALELVGVGVALVGVGLLAELGGSAQIGFGDLLTVGAATAFAAHILLLDYYSPKMGFEWLALVQISTAAAIALGTFWWVETPYLRWTSSLASAVLVTGLLATAVAFALQTWAQKHTTATRAALIFSLEPVFAWLTSAIVNHEVLTARATGGAFCILTGIILVELKPIGNESHPHS